MPRRWERRERVWLALVPLPGLDLALVPLAYLDLDLVPRVHRPPRGRPETP